MMTQSEKEFQAAVIEYAHLNGWLVHHGRAAQVREGKWVTPIQGDAGFPDLVMARNGLIVFAELKSEKGRISEGQDRWAQGLDTDRQPGGGVSAAHRYFLWRPADWDEIETTLKRSVRDERTET